MGGRQLLVARGLEPAGLMHIGEDAGVAMVSPSGSLLLGDTALPSPNPASPLNYFLPGLFDFKVKLGSWKPMETKGLAFFLSYTPPLGTLALHAVVTLTCLLHPERSLPPRGPGLFAHAAPFAWNAFPPVCLRPSSPLLTLQDSA